MGKSEKQEPAKRIIAKFRRWQSGMMHVEVPTESSEKAGDPACRAAKSLMILWPARCLLLDIQTLCANQEGKNPKVETMCRKERGLLQPKS